MTNPLLSAVESPPIAAARAWVAGRAFPAEKPFIDLSQAAPGYPPPPELSTHIAARLADPAAHRYTDILGLPSLREAYAAHLTAFYGAPIAPAETAVTAGCNQAYCLAILALAKAGDSVILPRPHYFNHRMWLDMQGVRAIPLDCRAEAGALPDPDEAERLIEPGTRAIVLVTPNNPTGAVYPPALVARFFDLAKRRGLRLILDETYKDFLPGEGRPHALFDDPDWRRTLVHLYSFSKVYALTGWRVGALTAGADLVEQVQKAMDCVAICAPRPAQEAALFGLENLGPWARANTAALRARGALFRAGLERANSYRLVSLGAYFAWLEHPFGAEPSESVARRLADEQNMLLLPGSMFGEGQQRLLRLAFANVADDLAPEVLRRLEA